MVYYVSGWQEEELLQIALAKLFAETTSAAEREKLAKMLNRALVCREMQGKKKATDRKARD